MDFFSKCDEISTICSHLLKKSLIENFIVCPVLLVEKIVLPNQILLLLY